MKKLIIPLAISSLLLLTSLQKLNAQVNLETVTIRGDATKAIITEKVSNSFSSLFKDAKEPQWLVVNKRYVVNFILDDQRNKAVFTKNGELVYHLSYGTEKNVPDQILKKIQSEYEGYTLGSAIKVTTKEKMLWMLNLENSKQILIIRATEEEMGVIDRIKKS
ncbi:hypothetical protein [Pedobacter gandavensis]|uniref:hypothetical protein n=1 Tax=Pedobacter gandavensis TaxID=2679963 RepID=UPI00292FDD95|nr:hypothetical protein [Pedobacter gandavensis]